MSEEKNEEKVLFEAIHNYCGGDAALAIFFTKAIKKTMDRLQDKGLFTSPRIRQLKNELRKVYTHSPFSYVELCLLEERNIDPGEVVRLFGLKESMSLKKEKADELARSEVTKKYLEILTAYVRQYLLWFGAGGERNQYSDKLDLLDTERQDLSRALRSIIYNL